jgi:hypothetical protein
MELAFFMYVHKRVAFYKAIIDGSLRYFYVPIEEVDFIEDTLKVKDIEKFIV